MKQLREDYCKENDFNTNTHTTTYYDYINQIYDVDDIKEEIAQIREKMKVKQSKLKERMKKVFLQLLVGR